MVANKNWNLIHNIIKYFLSIEINILKDEIILILVDIVKKNKNEKYEIDITESY